MSISGFCCGVKKSELIFTPVYQPDCSSNPRSWPPLLGVFCSVMLTADCWLCVPLLARVNLWAVDREVKRRLPDMARAQMFTDNVNKVFCMWSSLTSLSWRLRQGTWVNLRMSLGLNVVGNIWDHVSTQCIQSHNNRLWLIIIFIIELWYNSLREVRVNQRQYALEHSLDLNWRS